MPSIAPLEDGRIGEPILTKFENTEVLKKPMSLENQHFQNEISKTKQHYFESNTTTTTVTNGNHYNNHQTNGNAINGDSINGNGITYIDTASNGIHTNGNSNMINGNLVFAHQQQQRDVEKTLPVEGKIQLKGLESVKIETESDEAALAYSKDGKVYNNGPDQILPTNALHCWDSRGAVKIRLGGPEKIKSAPPISVPSLLKKCADRAPNKLAMRVKRNGDWVRWTYKEYLNDVRTAAKGFIALGLERYHSVCILGFNSPEWFISDLASIFAGGFAAGIYTTNTPEACGYCAIDSQANIFVVEDEKQLAKVLEIREKLPHLRAIIQYSGEPTTPGVLSWAKLMTLGSQQSDEKLEERLKLQAINQCCTLIYTSGTTGNPKGVMLSHDNLTWMSGVTGAWAEFREATETFQEEVLSFLPLSHVAAQMADIYSPLACCAIVTFADKNALKGSLVDNMVESRPTKFLAVPRVWEKMHEKIYEIGRRTTGIRRMIANWAKGHGLDCNLRRMNGDPSPESWGYKLARMIVFSKIHNKLGLDRSTLNLSGAAPISQDVLKFFSGIGRSYR